MAIYCIHCRSTDVQERVEKNKIFYFCSHCNMKSGKALVVDSKIKIINTSRGIKHINAAAVVIRDNKLLLLERRTYPYGLMIPAGHLEYGETLEETLNRELHEEIGIKVDESTLLAQIEQPVSYCRYGSNVEEWAVFLVDFTGEPTIGNDEMEAIHWIDLNDIPVKRLSMHTHYALTTLGYIKDDSLIEQAVTL